MSNIPEDMFKKPKPMAQSIKLPNIPGHPTIPAHMQSRPAGLNMPIVPNIQSLHNKPQNGQHQQITPLQRPNHPQLANQSRPPRPIIPDGAFDPNDPRKQDSDKKPATEQKLPFSNRNLQMNPNAKIPEHRINPKLQTLAQSQRPNMPLQQEMRSNNANIPTIKPVQSIPNIDTKDNQTDNQNTVLSFSHNRPQQPNIPNIPQANGVAQSISSRLNQHNHFVRPQVQTSSNQNGFLTSYSVKGSTGIQIPPGATKLIINAVAGGGAGAPNTETAGGGGAGAGVNGLIVPLNSLTHGTINVDVGIGGGATGTNGSDGTPTIITGNASSSNFSLTLGGGKGGSGNIGGISGNVQFFSKTVLASAINGGDCNYKNCFSSGGAGGAGNAPGTKGADGGGSLFQGGIGNTVTGAGGGGASCFANGGSGDGQLGSGGEGGHLGGDGFASLEFYI